jgi:hypothetical protein
MLYLGMGGRCGEDAGRLFVVKPRRRRPERKKGALGLADRGTLVAGLFGGLAVGKSSLVKVSSSGLRWYCCWVAAVWRLLTGPR